MRKKLVAVWLCAVMVASVFVLSADIGNDVEGKEVVKDGVSYIVSAPFRINSNADFATSPKVSGGDGSEGNPWIIENFDINGTGYDYCIYIGNTTDTFIIRNNNLHHANGVGYAPYYSDAGLILYNVQNGEITNNMASNNNHGFFLHSSNNNVLTNNTLTDNKKAGYYYHGLYLIYSYSNIIANNTILNNNRGIELIFTNGNSIYLNNFINNTLQAVDDSSNQWDGGYPSGGNYWSDYSGIDLFSGPSQNETGSDSIGDTPYTNILGGTGALDNYPLMFPWGPTVDLSIVAEDIIFSNPNLIPGEEITLSAKIFNQKQDLVTFDIPVKLGWNFISVPLVQDDTSTMEVLDDNGGDTTWAVAKWYNTLDPMDPWKTYRTGSTINDLKNINHIMGIWLYITNIGSDANLTVKGRIPSITNIPLFISPPWVQGWNMVGYPASENINMTAGDVKVLTGFKVTEILTFEGNATGDTGDIPFDNYTSLGDTDYLTRGKAYWFNVSGNCTWAIDNGLPATSDATATVSFYLDNIDEANLINRQFGIEVPGYGSTTVTTNWAVNVTGNHTIIVDVTDVDPADIDLLNNTAQRVFITASTFTIPLTPGWNLVSIPLEMSDTSVSTVMAPISGKWDVAKYYDTLDVMDPWKTYRVGSSLNDLVSIDNTMGFWIHATAACNLTVSGSIPVFTSIPLYAGWNLVGYPPLTFTESVANVFWGTGADRVEAFDPVSPYIKKVGPTYLMKPGEGYWVHVPADTVWTVEGITGQPQIVVKGDNPATGNYEYITLSNPEPTNGDTITITSTILNLGSADAFVDVWFYLDEPISANLINPESVTILVPSCDQQDAHVEWLASPSGIHTIIVQANVSPSTITPDFYDPDLSDNQNHTLISVTPKILLVDDDAHINDLSDGDTVSFMRASLEAADFSYDFIIVNGSSGPGYDYGDYPLQNYDVVIWMTGYTTVNTLTVGAGPMANRTDDVANLQKFLTGSPTGVVVDGMNGGSLWLISEGFWTEAGFTPGLNAFATDMNFGLRIPTIPALNAPLSPILFGNESHPVTNNWATTPIDTVERVPGTGNANYWGFCDFFDPTQIALDDGAINPINRRIFAQSYDSDDYPADPIVDSRILSQTWDFSRIQDMATQTQYAYKAVLWLGNITSKFTQDVAISEVSVEPEVVFYKQQVTIEFVVRNNGLTEYTPADNLWCLMRIMDINGTDMISPSLQRIDYLGINSNNTLTISCNWIPQEIGYHNISILIDPYNYIAESNEQNNGMSSELNVQYRILVVDDDDSLNNGGGLVNETQYVTNALDTLGYNYEIFTTYVAWPGPGFGDCGNQTTLDDYNAVIWVTGSAITPLMSLDIINITSYLEFGGNFWLLGNGIDTLGDPAFEQSYLKIASVDANQGMVATLRGVVNDSVSDGIAYACNGDANADTLIPSAVGIGFTYQNDAMTYFNSVRYEGQYRSAVTAWKLSSLTDSLSRADFVFRMLRWFDKP